MALNCFLRSASLKLKVCPLQSFTRSQLLRCSTISTNYQFHHTSTSQSPINSHRNMVKQSILAVRPPHQPDSLMQNAQFSVSAKRMAEHGHDHTKLWTAEKALAVGLLGIVPSAFIFPSQFMDYLLAVAIVTHNHWGIEAIVLDYVRPILFGNVIPKIAIGAVYVMSVAVLAGLFLFITNDVGIVNAIKQFWKL
ncbi:succinate dehydrogenase [ubiquinone] cytochrome b small subunit, mitochondrial [Periplaneta americana]|uniref:succinate dehydrogenase [ubiquinone] cytochrome b small subunit, mitochondrial n=1 Tax=Periplaneta americana TaxID=6978 RepID=UPI0037E9C160